MAAPFFEKIISKKKKIKFIKMDFVFVIGDSEPQKNDVMSDFLKILFFLKIRGVELRHLRPGNSDRNLRPGHLRPA